MKNLCLTIMLLAAFNASADTIVIEQTTDSYLDKTFVDVGDSHWDKREGGLEWLDFGSLVNGPMTFEHSLNSAEIAYDENNGGWRLATATEVYDLFELFFPTYVNSGDGTMVISDTGGTGDSPLIAARNSWLFAFGTDAEVTEGGEITLGTSTIFSRGLFYDEVKKEVGLLGLMVDTNPLLTTLYGPEYTMSGLTHNSWSTTAGVFMVRDYTPPVPIPAAIWLFGTGLIALLGVARRKYK